jgi:hypothetical protein
VRIIETRPLSSQKRWAILAVLGRNESLAEPSIETRPSE